MKFTREQAIEALVAKIPTKDKDLDLGRTVSEVVDNCIELVGENSEMELDGFVNIAFKQVKTSIGLVHNENSKVANKLREQIADLQRQVGQSDKKDNAPKDRSDGENELLAKLNAIEERLNKSDKENAIAIKRKTLADKMYEKGIKDKDWISSYLAEITVTEDTDVDAKADDYLAFYNKTMASGAKRTTTPKQAGGDNTGNYVKETLARVKAKEDAKKAIFGGNNTIMTTTVKD